MDMVMLGMFGLGLLALGLMAGFVFFCDRV